MTRSSLVNALLLVGALSTTIVGCGDDSDHDGDVGPDLGPADPIDDVCDVIAGGSRSGQLLEFDLARAYATWRLFSPSGDWLGGDEALARTLEDADDWTDDLAGRIVAELGEGCVVAADDDALNPASVELVGDVALVVPGSGDLMLPAGTSVVAVDLRGLPATDEADAALDVAVALALRQDLALATRVVRTFNGFPSQLYYTMNYYSSAEAYVDVTVAADGSVDLPLVLLTGGPLSPHAAELAAGLRIEGRAAIVGQDVASAAAESTWMPVGSSGITVRTSLMARPGASPGPSTGFSPWPDLVAADLSAADPTAWLDSLDDVLDTLAPLDDEGGRVDIAAWEIDDLYHAFGDPSLGEMRAAVLVAWGTIDRFFPYFDDVGRDIDAALPVALDEVAGLDAGDRSGFLDVFGHFWHELYDGHGHYGDPYATSPVGYLVIQMEQVDGVPLVRSSAHDDIWPGDTIVAVDGVPADGWFEEAMSRCSAATFGYRFDLAGRELRSVKTSRTLTLRDADGVERTVTPTPLPPGDTTLVPWGGTHRPSGWLDDLGAPDLYLLNLNGDVTTQMSQVLSAIDEARDAAGLVVDMRDYPSVNHYNVAPLLRSEPFTSATFSVPQWEGPSRTWRDETAYPFSPDPHAFTGPIVLLVSNKTVSAAENFSQMVYPGANVTVMGEQSAGTNGNITVMSLPGGFYAMFTGMEVINSDGTALHGIGIPLDIEVKPSALDYVDGVDPELMAAIEQFGE